MTDPSVQGTLDDMLVAQILILSGQLAQQRPAQNPEQDEEASIIEAVEMLRNKRRAILELLR